MRQIVQLNAYVLFSLISALLSSAALVYILHRRTAAGASSLAWLMLSITIWSFAYAMELTGAEKQIMRFWLRIEYLGIAFLPLWGVRFALQYTGHDKWLTRRNMVALCVIPVITLGLNWTNEWHRLFYSEVHIDTSSGMAVLALTKGIWYWVHIANMYVTYLLMAFLILHMYWRRERLYRVQAVTVVIAMLPPIIGNVLYLTNLSPFPNLDLSPFAFNVTGILIIWGLFSYRLFDVVPVARDILIESMSDGVLVLDIANCVVDINPAAKRLMGVGTSSVIGQHVETLLPAWTEFPACCGDEEKVQQKTIAEEDTIQHLDLRAVRLTDPQGDERGKLIILRDITPEKQLETEREELIHNLQDALAQVKTLSGLLPICANCKNIRDDQGYWHQVEVYIRDHSKANFSHGICPECARKLYPGLYGKGKPVKDPL